ncbi:MAG: cell wall hydrolase [Blautia sp.]|jgi:glucan-binding YG repeat protein
MKKNKKLLLLLAFVFCMIWTPVSAQGIGIHTVQAQIQDGWKQTGNEWYYYINGEKQTGFLKLGNKTYYFDRYGRMCTGLQKLTQGRYYMRADGTMVTNAWVKIGRYWYYFGDDGKALTSQFLKQDGKYYYVNQNGAMFTGLRTINGKKYYFNSSGVMQRGWVMLNKYWYYFNSNGAMHHGWLYLGDETYFCLKSGKMATGRIKNSKGQAYFFNNGNVKSNNSKVGELQKGWTTVGANKYHFNETTGVMSFGLITDGGKKYYLDTTSGAMRKGWQEVNGKKYYFKLTGEMAVSETLIISSRKYVFDANGDWEVEYQVVGNVVKVTDTNGLIYSLEKEFLEHPGIADNTVSDRDLFAMLIDAEANDQGLAGMTLAAVTILNRTISSDTWFPRSLRYVIYQDNQYAPVRDGALLRRLNGSWESKAYAYQAVDAAQKIVKAYQSNKTPRRISGVTTAMMGGKKDFDCLYFMTPGSFTSLGLNWNKCETFQYKGHVFFTNWEY